MNTITEPGTRFSSVSTNKLGVTIFKTVPGHDVKSEPSKKIIAKTVTITPKKNFAGNLLLSFFCFGIAFGTIV